MKQPFYPMILAPWWPWWWGAPHPSTDVSCEVDGMQVEIEVGVLTSPVVPSTAANQNQAEGRTNPWAYRTV
jgi:hypothetical protein